MENELPSNTSQPIVLPPESAPSQIISSHYKGIYIFIFIGIVLLGVVGVGAYMMGKNASSEAPENTKKNPQVTITTAQSTVVPTSLAVLTTRDAAPLENVLYFASYEGEDALFYTNKEEQKYYEGGVEKTSPHVGTLTKASGTTLKPFDYTKLTNTKRLQMAITTPIQAIDSLKLNDAKSFLYVSLNLEEKASSQYPDNLVNHVYQVNMKDLSSKEIWVNELGSTKYTGKGAAYIDVLTEDKFIVLKLGSCYACGGHPPTHAIVLNVETKNEKFVDEAGDFQFNLPGKTFTYKKLAPFKEPCQGGPDCDENNEQTVMKPSGQDFAETLP
jgi:hypothetical protein